MQETHGTNRVRHFRNLEAAPVGGLRNASSLLRAHALMDAVTVLELDEGRSLVREAHLDLVNEGQVVKLIVHSEGSRFGDVVNGRLSHGAGSHQREQSYKFHT